ncbi:MAG: hypothetical protein RLZZ28_1095 [Bacteroidota bacterium]|jgi:hypothetical protein
MNNRLFLLNLRAIRPKMQICQPFVRLPPKIAALIDNSPIFLTFCLEFQNIL